MVYVEADFRLQDHWRFTEKSRPPDSIATVPVVVLLLAWTRSFSTDLHRLLEVGKIISLMKSPKINTSRRVFVETLLNQALGSGTDSQPVQPAMTTPGRIRYSQLKRSSRKRKLSTLRHPQRGGSHDYNLSQVLL